jgi:hypothetical protein
MWRSVAVLVVSKVSKALVPSSSRVKETKRHIPEDLTFHLRVCGDENSYS